MAEREIITTIAMVGDGAQRMLERHNADPANFVFPVYEGDTVIQTPFGKVGVGHYMHEVNVSNVRTVQLDCSDAPGLLWRSRSRNPFQNIAVNHEGTGSQQVRDFEIFVATKHFQR